MESGQLYGASHDEEALGSLLLARMLLQACNGRGRVTLVSGGDPAKARLPDALKSALAEQARAGMLQVFRVPAQQREMDARFLDTLLGDLNHLAPASDLIVFDQADSLFPQPEPGQLARLREEAVRRQSVIVLLFRLDRSRAELQLRLMALASQFAGMAAFRQQFGQVTLKLLHWFSEGGLVAGKSVPLAVLPEGGFAAMPEDQEAPQAQVAEDEDIVLASQALFQPGEQTPPDWQVVPEDLDLIASRSGKALATTFILSFTQSSSFERLARCVHAIRHEGGARVKIVLREVNCRLRYSQEALLRSLGANLIVPAEVSYPRFLGMVQMVQGQVFPRAVALSYEAALAAATPVDEMGYLPPQDFIPCARLLLARSRNLRMHCALLRMPLAYGLLPQDALRYCRMRRPGDICTADERHVYVFLFACRETDVDKTLEFIFGLPIGELFLREVRSVTPRDIEDAIDRLYGLAAQQSLPDLSSLLDTQVARAPVLQAVPNPSPAAPSPATPGAARFTAPAPATRRPLPLRTLTTVSNLK